MVSIALTQMAEPVLIGGFVYQSIPVVYAEEALRVSVCGRCGSTPGSAAARICTHIDCGLVGRLHERRNAA